MGLLISGSRVQTPQEVFVFSSDVIMDYQAPVAQSVERVTVKPPAGWWTKNVAYARVRVPSGAVLGPGR